MYHINYHSNFAALKAHYALLPGLHFETVKAAREFSEREAYKVMHTLHQECPGVLFDRSDTDRSVTIRLGFIWNSAAGSSLVTLSRAWTASGFPIRKRRSSTSRAGKRHWQSYISSALTR